MDKKTLTVKELQEYLNIGRRLAYELANTPGFPSFRIGKKVLINVDGLKTWIDKQVQK